MIKIVLEEGDEMTIEGRGIMGAIHLLWVDGILRITDQGMNVVLDGEIQTTEPFVIMNADLPTDEQRADVEKALGPEGVKRYMPVEEAQPQPVVIKEISCAIEGGSSVSVNPQKLLPLLAACLEFKNYMADDPLEDGIAKCYDRVGGVAVRCVLGVDFVKKIDELLA